jgi:hypothetical protein
VGGGDVSTFVGPIKEIVLGIYDGPHATPPEAESGPVFLGIMNVTERGTFGLLSNQAYFRTGLP